MLIKLGEVHTKVVIKARSWMKDDQSKWCKITLGKDDEVEISLKAKVKDRVLFLLAKTQ